MPYPMRTTTGCCAWTATKYSIKETVDAILKLKWAMNRTGYGVADMSSLVCSGRKCRTIYPVSSPDYPVRLFNRTQSRFNNRPVDDQVEGFLRSERIHGYVRHDTFYSLHELFNKLNGYTTRFGSISDDTSLSWSRRDQRYRRIFQMVSV